MADHGRTRTRTEESVEAQLRLACEECHARKIRCELSAATSGGRCKACALNQRQCLFSLRNRTGRPRKQPLSPLTDPPRNSRTTGGPLQDGQAHMWSPDDAGWNTNGSTWQAQQPGWDTVGQLIMHGSGIGSLSDAGFSDMGSVGDSLQIDPIVLLGSPGALNETDGEGPSGRGDKGFLDALNLYSRLHNNCKSTTLDLLTEAGRYKVRVICNLFDELSQAAFALQDDTLHASPTVRSDMSEAKIIVVALSEAIQVCIEIIQHNFQIHQSTATAPGNHVAGADEKQLGVQQNGLELLICLEFSLIRFRHVMSKVESLVAGAPQGNCDCWISSAPKVDTARSQVSALLKKFRNFQD